MSETLTNIESAERRVTLKELIQKYMAGDSHEHTVFSNPSTRHEADYTFEQIFKYVLEEMKEGESGMEFIIFVEHPSDAGNPEKVDGNALLEHQNKIHEFSQIQRDKGIGYPHLISGVEADIICDDGKGDDEKYWGVNVPQEVLEQMDFVVASKHDLKKVFPEKNGNPNAEELTKMYMGLMANPHIDVIGHLNRNVPYETLTQMDWDKILLQARDTNTALEININAPMPEWLIIRTIEAGVPIFIGTDAHTLWEYHQNLPNEIKEKIEGPEENLHYPLGVRYNFWKKVSKILRTLESCNADPNQIISSSYERLNAWLSQKSQRAVGNKDART
ncbi:MAG: hypothetical protein HW405_120 [Candidatus Berkelbacteria bacterium]|nr:hypothetical protein [Candidatus Berkelbacteria bacterium]